VLPGPSPTLRNIMQHSTSVTAGCALLVAPMVLKDRYAPRATLLPASHIAHRPP
jgi:hypothetical protein